jgi:serine/threonine-protein kinase RsbW
MTAKDTNVAPVTVQRAVASRPAGRHASAFGPLRTLEVPSRVESMDLVDAFVGEVATSAGFDPDSARDVEIAVHEAVVNAIVHANGGDPSRRVRLAMAVGRAGLEVCVEDEGPGFDPGNVPDPLAMDNLYRPRGRGIFFMRLLMDDVSFGRAPHGGTLVTLLKRRAERARATRPEPAVVCCAS